MRSISRNGIAIAFFAAFGWTAAGFAAGAAPHWEAVNPQVAAGKPVRLDVRLIGTDGKPVTGKVSVTEMRLDMGPDNMAAMTTAVRPVAGAQAGVTSFQGQLSQGRWALTISANVAGLSQPVAGQVVFTAVAPK
jgi:hypothetical protein